MNCPCQSEQLFEECCGPFLSGENRPATAEKLMRSRYTAYTLKNMDYIYNTHDPKTRGEVDMEANREWAENVTWKGLEIIGVAGGGAKDQEGHVEFKAYYNEDGEEYQHHELGEFIKRQGHWYFHEGKDLDQETIVREEPKIGRNDPCPCGSGKKYKKCCGAVA